LIPSTQLSWVQTDQLRRACGILLDQLGLGPVESPWRTAFAGKGVRLRAYHPKCRGPALVIVSAPIKRPYIWDLSPKVSVVRRGLERGWRVFLIEWLERKDEDRGLADYADRLIVDCLDAIRGETNLPRVTLVGHSIGGTLAAVCSAIHPERVAGLMLLETPLKFGDDAGSLGHLATLTPTVRLREVFRTIPGTLLDIAAVTALPWSFVLMPYVDAVLIATRPTNIATHLRVRRWTLDETPLPGHLFEEVVDRLYREDRFYRGTLIVNRRRASPEAVTMPLLTVLGADSRIVPLASAVLLHEKAPSREKRLLRYGGDPGVALPHVGTLVGESAHRHLWPDALQWLWAHTAD